MRDVLLPILLVAVAAGVVLLLAATNPVLARMAVRNALRRRSRLLIVTFGLLVGTMIIASSLTVGDTLEFIFTGDAYERFDAIDVTVAREVNGEFLDFPESNFHALRNESLARGLSFDGMAPVLLRVMPVRNEDAVKGNQAITVLGLADEFEEGFGSLVTADGRTVSTADLAAGWVYLNQAAAKDLNASLDDRLTLFFGTTNQTLVFVQVKDIARDEGKAAYEHLSLIFLPLAAAQTDFDAVGEINLIKVSAPGPVIGGEGRSAEIADGLRSIVLDNRWPLDVSEVKADALDTAQTIADQASELFLVMGSFAITAGVLLLVNLFVMLAEERKAEMGVSRAVGMKRLHLMLTYLFEGSLYAGLAAFAGAIAGLGLGWLMIQIFNIVFADQDGFEGLVFHGDPGSIVLAFAMGVLISLAAVVVAAMFVSRLNIVRAIRNLPEPPAERLSKVQRWLVFLTLFGGSVLFVRGFGLVRPPLPALDLSPLPLAGAAVLLAAFAGYLVYRITEREVAARAAWLLLGAALVAVVFAGAYNLLVLPPGGDESIGAYRIASVPSLFLGFATLAARRTGPRIPFTLAGLGILWWLLLPPLDLIDEARDDVAVLFVETGVLLVLGAVLVAVFNTSPLLRSFLNRFGRRGRPVVRAAVSYPMGKKFRTGMTLAMFALTIFSITVIAMVQGMQAASVDRFIEGQSGGYQIVAYAAGYVPIDNFTELLEANVSPDYFVDGWNGTASASVLSVNVNKSGDANTRGYTLWGVDNFLIERNTYGFYSHLPSITYSDADGTHTLPLNAREDVWRALRLNRSYAVVDRSAAGADQFTPDFGQLRMNLGDHIFAGDGEGNVREFVILGILEQSLQFTRGIFVDRETVLETYDLNVTRTAYFFQLNPGVDGNAVREELERTFFRYGLVTLDIREEIETQFEASDRVLLLMQAYLALGLLVGITGLGVITIRAVVERRQEIGALRALGFTRRMVRNVFLLEIALVAFLGIAIGMGLGIVLAYNVYRVYFASIAVFTIPVLHLAAVAAIGLVATLLATAGP
ncbi:MAG: FtsX-like permease family protein, partial [Euryarchaeota archaeon]|nr:FtsX-like permease family protein [Euryarchaeota archaeon]